MTKEQLVNQLEEILAMQKVVMMEHNGREDCKNCSLAEAIEDLLNKEKL